MLVYQRVSSSPAKLLDLLVVIPKTYHNISKEKPGELSVGRAGNSHNVR